MALMLTAASTASADERGGVVLQIARGGMEAVMGVRIHDLQILGPVVRSITVDMVDVFMARQPPAHQRFYDHAVHANASRFARSGRIEVTARVRTNQAGPSVDRYMRSAEFISCVANLYHAHYYMALGGGIAYRLGPGHAEAGESIARAFMQRIGAPVGMTDAVCELTKYHMRHVGGVSGKAARRLAREIKATTPAMLRRIMEADHSGRPWTGEFMVPASAVEFTEAMTAAVEAVKPLILGRHLIEMGMQPGRQMGQILRMVEEAQVEGVVVGYADAYAYAKGLVQAVQ